MSDWVCLECGENYEANCDMYFRHAIGDCRRRIQAQRDEWQRNAAQYQRERDEARGALENLHYNRPLSLQDIERMGQEHADAILTLAAANNKLSCELDKARSAMRRLFIDAIGCISERRLDTYRRECPWVSGKEE